MTCKIPECEKPAKQRGWCHMHYRRWYIHGDPNFTMREPPQPGRPCGVSGCDRPYEGRGYCKSHRRLFIKYGTPYPPPREIKICAECGSPAKARGLCEMHYQRWRKHGDVNEDGRRSLAERLQAHLVRADSGCLEWRDGATRNGYGQIGDGRRVRYAHRVAYELAYGPFSDDLDVLHRCDNPPCCEPTHLFLGTAADNNADMIAKGRAWWQKEAGAA